MVAVVEAANDLLEARRIWPPGDSGQDELAQCRHDLVAGHRYPPAQAEAAAASTAWPNRISSSSIRAFASPPLIR